MPVIHECDRCGHAERYVSTRTKSDPLGEKTAPSPFRGLCADCEKKLDDMREQSHAYFRACEAAWRDGQPQPPAPQLW